MTDDVTQPAVIGGEEALQLVAAQLLQDLLLCGGFHALGDHLQAQRLRTRADGPRG